MTAIEPAAATTLVALVAGVFGILIGSFLNVVVYRVPIGMSLIAPPSACPNCHTAIKPWDNIPVLSWLLLGGRCRKCEAPISVRYPLVEAGTAVFFVGVAIFFAGNVSGGHEASGAIAGGLALVAFLYLAAITVALGLIDIETQRLPDAIVLPGYLVAAILFTASAMMSGDYSTLLRAAIGMAALWLAYVLMVLAYPKGMGFGDVKLAGLLGIYLGWVGWGALAIGGFAAFALGGIYGLGLIIARRAGRKSAMPFGPWMLAGAWVGIFFGNQLWIGYLSIFGLG